MGGIVALKKVQFGLETQAGTAVVSDTVWRGTGEIKDARELVMVDEQVGSLLPVGNQYESHKEATFTMGETEATFEQLPFILTCAVKAMQTGVVDTDGSGYIYIFTLATGSVQTPNTATIECGDNQRVDEMEYSFVTDFDLNGAAKEAWKVTANWVGRQATDAELTTGISLVAVEPILFGKTNFYLDTTAVSIGTTTKSSTLVAFNSNWNCGHIPLYAADGAAYFSAMKTVGAEITGSLTLEHDATGEAEITAARARSLRYIRVKAEGSDLDTSGTYVYKTMTIDLAIQYDEIPEMGDADGNRTVELPWHAVDGVAPVITVVNEIAAM